jgi:trimethylamine---corrinoid protein Co-methyltransferase
MNQNKTKRSHKQAVQIRVLEEVQCTDIVNAAYQVLERTGCDVYDDEALRLLADAGCKIEGKRVFIPSDLLEKAIKSAPSNFTLYNRSGEPTLFLEPYNSYFGPGPTNPMIIDVETGERRKAIKNDVVNAARVCDALPNIDWATALATVSDCHPMLSDIHEVHALLQNTNKPILTWAINKENCEDIIDMCAAVAGGMNDLAQKPFFLIWCDPTTPLQHQGDAVKRLMYMAEKQLPVLYAPAIMLGGTGPVTLAGNLAVGLADTLVGLLISQLKHEGTPFIVANFTDIMDLKTGGMVHCGPELSLGQAASADLFRYLNLPFIVHLGSTDSPVFDQQAAAEIAIQLYTGMLCGANLNSFIGFLETAMSGSLDCLVFGDEVISLLRGLTRGIEVTPETLAVDAIHRVGPGGHFMGDKHTFNHFKEIWYPKVFNRTIYEKWEDQGKKDLKTRLNEKVKRILSDGCKNPLPAESINELDRILEKAQKRVGEPI